MTVGIILAAGKGTRFQSNGTNKTATLAAGKPLISYGVELFQNTTDRTYVVVGAYGESVRVALAKYNDLTFIEQQEQLGTGHATRIAVDALVKEGAVAQTVLLGYGDHLMCYTPDIVRAMLAEHIKQGAAITLVTVNLENPNDYRWGRIVRSMHGTVKGIVEQKDANEEERAITECNAGFYVFDYDFLKENVSKLEKSPVTGEYYVTDLIAIAVSKNKVVLPYPVSYEYVGSGVNTVDQLQDTARLLTARE